VGKRSVNVECLAGYGFLPVWLKMLERTHVVEPVSELDKDHSHIRNHSEKHLANVFSLPIFSIGELNCVDLCDALDDVRDLVAKASLDLLTRCGGVFNGVVQQAGGDGRRIELHLGQHFSNLKGMNDVGLSRGSHLAAMMLHTEVPCLANKAYIFAGPVGLNLAQQGFKALIDGTLIVEAGGWR